MNGEKVLAELSVSEALCFGEFLGNATLSQNAVEEALTFFFQPPAGKSC